MLQDMDHIEASCIFHVKVGMLDHLEQREFCVLTVTKWGIVIIKIQDNSIFNVSSIYDHGDLLRQSSPAVLSVKESPVYM